ncbi:MAG TPA: iron ABC transporter permease [Bacteriovoracaceae bacterium]|nr:iron ABC transporter permease [Bacteriovoracaceae bacterium]
MKKAGLSLLMALLFMLCVYPFLFLGQSFSFENGQFDYAIFHKALTNPMTIRSFWNTMFICGSTVFISTIISIPMAWLFTRTDLRFRGFWRTAFCLPYAIPPFIGAIAWIYLANPSNGLLKNLIPGIDIYTKTGLIFVMTAFFYTYILINLLSAMEKIDPSLEEAARISGASSWQVFCKITLPLIVPSLISGMLLAFLSAIANFGIAALIGNPAGISMMTTQIFIFQKMASYTGLKLSGVLSLLLLFIASLVFFMDHLISKRFRFSLVTGKSARPSLTQLGPLGLFAQLFLFMMAIIFFIFPMGAILIAALSKLQGERSLANFGLQNFSTIFFKTDETYRALGNSLMLALSAGVLCSLLGYFLSQSRGPINKLKEAFIAIPYAMPGTVLALSFILTTLSLRLPLYNTLGIILLAYIAKFLNFSYRIINDGVSQVDPSLIDAAQVAGANSWQVFIRIWIPILRPFLMASFFLVFMPAFSELTMSVLLTGPGNETIGTLIFQMQEYGDASGGGAAVLAFCVLLMIISLNALLKITTKGKYGL